METIKLIAAFTPILLLVVGAATAYLRLFIRNELNEFVKGFREEFVSKEVFESKSEALELRVVKMAGAGHR